MFPAHHEPAVADAPRRKFHKLRIAWSVGCGMVCLLLIGLWARSHHVHDSLWFTSSTNTITGIASYSGVVVVQRMHVMPGFSPPGWHYDNRTDKASRAQFHQFQLAAKPAYWLASVPLWLIVALVLVIGSCPWFHWRFSLRTLLIATTLIAVGLGLVAYAIRQ